MHALRAVATDCRQCAKSTPFIRVGRPSKRFVSKPRDGLRQVTDTSRTELRAILDAAVDGIVTIDNRGTILSANPGITRLLGYASTDVRGRNIAALVPETFCSQHGGFLEQYIADEKQHNVSSGRKTFARHTDGHPVPIWLTINEYEVDGEVRFAGVMSDLSAYEKQQTALEESELLNRLTVDNAVIGITLTDLNGKWMLVNHAVCTMLGYTESDLLALGFSRITHAQDIQLDYDQVQRLHNGEVTSFTHEKRYIRKDGSLFWVRVHVAGVYDDDDRLTHHSTQVVNIDAEKVALEQNARLQQQMQAFIEHVPANITVKDAEGRYTLVNRKLANSLNVEPESLIGKTIDALGFEGRSVNHLWEDENHILSTGEIIEREVRATWDPTRVLRATRFPVLGADGAVIGTGSISTDITEAKENESELLIQARTIGLLQHIAVAVNESERSHAAMKSCLKLLCQYMDWPFGHISRPHDSGDYLESADICYAPDENGTVALRASCRQFTYRRGDGLAGRVWQSKQPESEMGGDDPMIAVFEGAAAAIAFPIIVDGKVVAVFQCYAPDPIVLDEHLIDLLAFVDAQVGHAIDRETAKRATVMALDQLSYHINNSAVGVIQVDRDLRFMAWSPQCEEIFGWCAKEVLGKRWDEINIVHPDDAHLLTEVSTRLDDPGFTSFNLFHRNITKSGRVIHVDWYNSIMRDESGRLISTQSIAVDRTAEVEAQRALEEERNLFVAGPTMVVRWRDEPGWPIEYASPNMIAILGYQPADLATGKVASPKWVHPDDFNDFQQDHNEFRRSRESQWTYKPFRMRTASGEAIWVKAYASRVPGSTAADHFVAYAVDITRIYELQEQARMQEERLRNVIEGTSAGTWEWNVVTGETVFNDHWAEMLGYTLGELGPLSIDTWLRLAHPDDLERSNELLQDHFDGKIENYDFEGRMRHKDGHWVWIHDRGKLIERAPDGTALRVAGTHMDITQRKCDEAKILEANEELRKSNVELERFAYIASHDLQEPLRMVASFTQLLERNYSDKLDDAAREYIYFAVDGAKRMQQLIKDLLSYSRLGTEAIEETSVDMSVVVARVVQSLQLSIDESSAEVISGRLPVVRGDSGQLYQLMQNLIANALKYHKDDHVEITIGSEQRDTECVFWVRDNGIGMDGQYADRIFEVFQRLHTRAEYPGTGIGLSICKRIVERHGGRIWVESTIGEGAAFFFTLEREHAGGVELEEAKQAAQRSVA